MSSYDEKDWDSIWTERRLKRERIAEKGVAKIWGKSPNQSSDESESDSDDDRSRDEVQSSSKKKSRKSKKRKRHDDKKRVHKHKKLKKHKKSKKKRRIKKHKKASSSSSESSSSSSDEDSNSSDSSIDNKCKSKTKKLKKSKKHKKLKKSLKIENDKKKSIEESREDIVKKGEILTESDPVYGPEFKHPSQIFTNKELGKALLPGEGAAMAAYVAEGKRIPRRGEIGLTSDQIESYEKVGFVMSGSRHRRMEAVRIRKENQIYSADEKRALAMFSKEERQKREHRILDQFREMVKNKLVNKK